MFSAQHTISKYIYKNIPAVQTFLLRAAARIVSFAFSKHRFTLAKNSQHDATGETEKRRFLGVK